MTAQTFAPEKTRAVQKKLVISNKLSLPLEAALWTFADLAIKGAGKTYAAADIAEEMMKNGIPILVVDPIGVWWGLRVGADETKQGYPVVIFGGEHKDIAIPTRIDSKSKFPQIDEDRLKLMVKSILEAGISAVVDTSEFSKHMQRRASTIILRELFQLNKRFGTRHVFLEEVDTLAPQRLSGELNESFGAVDEIVRRGGNFNLGATLISQRPAVVNKDILTQCNCLIILRILAKLDKDAVATWVKEISGRDPKKYSKWYDSLKDLKNGEAWIWHPESDLFEKIQFRKRETLHATREYFQQEAWEQKNINLMDASDFIAKFKSKFEPKKLPEKTVGETIAEGYEKAAKQLNPTPVQVQQATQFFEEKQSQKQPEILTEFHKASDRATELALTGAQEYIQNKFLDQPVKQFDQSLPQIQINQYKPNLTFGVELPNEPNSIMGKVCVVLKTTAPPQNRQYRWSNSVIQKHLVDHSWDSSGYEDAIEQLIRWEILTKTSDGHLRFDPSRVKVEARS